jgi:prefoldin subunit 5
MPEPKPFSSEDRSREVSVENLKKEVLFFWEALESIQKRIDELRAHIRLAEEMRRTSLDEKDKKNFGEFLQRLQQTLNYWERAYSELEERINDVLDAIEKLR